MPWPIDDLDVSDLAANSGNLARARNQLYHWQSKIKETLAASPLVYDDLIYYVKLEYDNNTVSIIDNSANAAAFTVGMQTASSDNGVIALTHNLGVAVENLIVMCTLTNPSTAELLQVYIESWREADEGSITTLVITELLANGISGYSGAVDVCVTLMVIT